MMYYNRNPNLNLFKLNCSEFIEIVAKKIKVEPKTTDPLPEDIIADK